jgi:hypothetical protein
MTNDLQLPGGLRAEDLDLQRFKIRLRLREPARFGFLHGAMLHRLVTSLLGEGPPPGLFPLALESGHVKYEEGDAYDFVLSAAAGEPRRRLEGLEKALRVAGRQRPVGPARATSLEGLYDVEGFEPLPRLEPGEVMARVEQLASKSAVRIKLASPLRLRRKPERSGQDTSQSSQAEWLAGQLLGGQWRRHRQLSGLPPAEPPALPPHSRLKAERPTRLDLPLELCDQDLSGGPAPTTLSGLCGSLLAENLPKSWLLLLVLMEEAQAGSATEYGFGSYTLGELPEWHRPASTYLERLTWYDEVDAEGAAKILEPAAVALLDEGPAFYRRGLSRLSAEGGLKRAREQGLNGPVGGAGDRFVAQLEEAEVMARLEALWPGEPLIARFEDWLEVPAEKAKLTRLLSKIFAVELADALQEEGRRLVRMGNELRVLGRHAARVA